MKKEIHLNSDIRGTGHGSAHSWKRGDTIAYPRKATVYTCQTCRFKFAHFYDDEPDIFKAMFEWGVTKECENPSL